MIFGVEGRFPMMRVTIQKWGNSLGVRLPKAVLTQLQLGQGAVMECKVEESSLRLIPVERSRADELERLLATITPDNLHHLDYFEDEVGGEKW